MRALTTALASLVFLFGVAASVHSQDAATPSTQTPERVKEIRRDFDQRRLKFEEESRKRQEEAKGRSERRLKEVRERVEKKRDEAKKRIAEHRKDSVKRFIARVVERLNKIVGKLEQIANRVQERIDKIAAEGEDTTEAQAHLGTARVKLAEARGQIAALEGFGGDLVESDDPKAFFQGFKDEVMKVKDTLKAAHRELALAVSEIKGVGRVKTEGEQNE